MLKDHSLRNLNTFGINVKAAEYSVFRSIDELKACLKQASRVPWVLGGGSNLLLTDDLQLAVLQNRIDGMRVVEESVEDVVIEAGAGVVWHDLVTWCVNHGYGGIENLALIPGTVGAAPIQNIGAYGRELTEVFDRLTAVRLSDGTIRDFEQRECAFGYRDSIFKGELRNVYCVAQVRLRLRKDLALLDTSYGAIRAELANQSVVNAGIRDVYNAVIGIRSSKLPDPGIIGNAGSFFKNPLVSAEKHASLMQSFPGIPAYAAHENQYKIAAGWLIEQCGWKGRRIGNVGCYEKQALVIINYGEATGLEIYEHALRVQKSVSETFGIELQTEVNILDSQGQNI